MWGFRCLYHNPRPHSYSWLQTCTHGEEVILLRALFCRGNQASALMVVTNPSLQILIYEWTDDSTTRHLNSLEDHQSAKITGWRLVSAFGWVLIQKTSTFQESYHSVLERKGINISLHPRRVWEDAGISICVTLHTTAGRYAHWCHHCVDCPEDMVEHTVEVCHRWVEPRRVLLEAIGGGDLSRLALVQTMMRGGAEVWERKRVILQSSISRSRGSPGRRGSWGRSPATVGAGLRTGSSG